VAGEALRRDWGGRSGEPLQLCQPHKDIREDHGPAPGLPEYGIVKVNPAAREEAQPGLKRTRCAGIDRALSAKFAIRPVRREGA
jgi:hypothetical protein